MLAGVIRRNGGKRGIPGKKKNSKTGKKGGRAEENRKRRRRHGRAREDCLRDKSRGTEKAGKKKTKNEKGLCRTEGQKVGTVKKEKTATSWKITGGKQPLKRKRGVDNLVGGSKEVKLG